ncbi:hypothetical protein AXW84_14215 [Hymenobacter sp. PAMC 26628]|nr:hypothetical protein AXW84_14215 [Hymenobacter sp. PAMC 26628]
MPLAFFYLSVIILLTFAEQAKERSKFLYMLAGIMGGLAAWTKNEGLLFVIAAVLSRLVIAYKGDWKMGSKSIGYFVMGLAPILLVLLYFKVHFTPANDLVSGQNLSTFHKLASPSRYYLVIRRFILTGLSFGGWIESPAILLITYALMFGTYSVQEKSTIANSLVIAITLLGYFFVYIVTPVDLTWHLDTSLNRLLLQLYPSMLFSYFMVVASPTHILQPKKKEKLVLHCKD